MSDVKQPCGTCGLPGTHSSFYGCIDALYESRKELKSELDKDREQIKQMDQALRRADASLSALNGLYVTEDFDEYGDAQRNGLDPNGAWDCFVESMATIDERATLATIRRALQLQVAGDAKATTPEPEEVTA